jgi:hypothetical protein
MLSCLGQFIPLYTERLSWIQATYISWTTVLKIKACSFSEMSVTTQIIMASFPRILQSYQQYCENLIHIYLSVELR